METKSRQATTSSTTQKVITIKHGSAPEIQAVNISVKKRRPDGLKQSDELLYGVGEAIEQPFYRKRPLSKTMTTTKSTMTNEEDYQNEVAKLLNEVEIVSHMSSAPEKELEHLDENTDDEQIAVVKQAQEQHHHKALAWKMTPKVHFPTGAESPLGSPFPTESLPHYQGSLVASSKVVDWNYLPEPIIDPPFEHRPDKSYLIHQNQPIPLNPLKVWPGYGGNLYFEPVRVESKPLNVRDGQQPASRSRSRATSRYTYGDQTTTTPDVLSDSRYMSLPPSSPIRPGSRKNTPTMSYKHPMQELRGSQPNDLLFQRKMAHLDKNFVLNMKGNPKLHEDWSWIAGMESIGTLCIGDTETPLRKQPQKPYSRTLLVEKVPRKFVFHPGNNPKLSPQSDRPVPLVQVKIDTKKRTRDLSPRKLRNSEKSLSKQRMDSLVSEQSAKHRELKRRLQLPSIPIRIKGHKVNETSCYNPWDMFKIGTSSPIRSNINSRNSGTTKPVKSRATDLVSRSRSTMHTSPDDKENLSFAITRWLTPTSAEKIPTTRTLIPKPNAYPPQSAGFDTDDEDKLNYETIRSVYYSSREQRSTGDGRRVPNSTPC